MGLSEKGIGKIIKKARLNKKLTSKQLTQKVGEKREYIARIESESGDYD